MNGIKNLLLTTDFSETSRRAVAPAAMLARTFGARIILLHVTDLFLPIAPEYYALDLEQLRRGAEAQARQELERFAAQHLPKELDVELACPTGVPHAEIVDLAAQRGVDLIVMATHGRGFLAHVLLGSTAERVLRHAPCPVLVVRDRDETGKRRP